MALKKDFISKGKVKNAIMNIIKQYPHLSNNTLNKNTERSFCNLHQDEDSVEQSLDIGIKDVEDCLLFVPNEVFVKKIVEVYHEIQHSFQHQLVLNTGKNKEDCSNFEKEICLTIVLKSKYTGIENQKYSMLVTELDAELYGILNAKAFFENNFPSIDFEKHLVSYVNNVERWYGKNSLKKERPKFASYKEIVGELLSDIKIAYDYPTYIEYNWFGTKQECSDVANLKSGSEQFYRIAKDLHSKNLIEEQTLEDARYLMDYYKCKNIETIDDIKLDIDTEDCIIFEQGKKKDIGKEGFDYEDRQIYIRPM